MGVSSKWAPIGTMVAGKSSYANGVLCLAFFRGSVGYPCGAGDVGAVL